MQLVFISYRHWLECKYDNEISIIIQLIDRNIKLNKQIGSVLKCFFSAEILIQSEFFSHTMTLKGLHVPSISPDQITVMDCMQACTQSSTAHGEHCSPSSNRHKEAGPYLSLHWLSVQYRIHFKILLFVFKVLHGLAFSVLGRDHTCLGPCQRTEISRQATFRCP